MKRERSFVGLRREAVNDKKRERDRTPIGLGGALRAAAAVGVARSEPFYAVFGAPPPAQRTGPAEGATCSAYCAISVPTFLPTLTCFESCVAEVCRNGDVA